MQTSKILTGLLSVTLMVSSLLFGQEKKDAPKDAPKDRLSLSSESLKINGDLRTRYEWRERDINNVEDHRNRFRTRFRLGASFTVSPEVNVHAGLASGGNSSGTSSNQTWNTNSEWETHSIWLDYAYAEIIFGKELPRLMAGVQKNPYVSSNLLLDGDLRPTGYTITHKLDPVFMTMGWYNLRHRTFGGISDRADGNMVAAQVGVATKGDISFTAALGYFHANNQYSYVIFGPTTDYKFRVVDVYGDVSVKVAKDVKVGGYLELGRNLGVDSGNTQITGAPAGYDSEDNDTFYTLGVKADINMFKVKAAYIRVEGDSVFANLSDSDLGDVGIGGTDVKGYMLSVGMQIFKPFSVELSYYSLDAIERANREGQMFRVDLNYKF